MKGRRTPSGLEAVRDYSRPEGWYSIRCHCGFTNIENIGPKLAPPVGPGSTSFVPRPSPTCARCQKVLAPLRRDY